MNTVTMTRIPACEHENEFEDDSKDIICTHCGEHATPVICEDCKDNLGSSCCGY